jgi:hypothetical protein
MRYSSTGICFFTQIRPGRIGDLGTRAKIYCLGNYLNFYPRCRLGHETVLKLSQIKSYLGRFYIHKRAQAAI